MELSSRAKSYILWLPAAYLITVGGVYVSGWYAGVAGQFQMAPLMFVVGGQAAHVLLAILLFHSTGEHPATIRHTFRLYVMLQALFFVGLAVYIVWRQIAGGGLAGILTFWYMPYVTFGVSLGITPFFLVRFFRSLDQISHIILTIVTTGTALAFYNFYFQTLWLYGPLRILGLYGEAILFMLLGSMLFWALRQLPSVPLAVGMITLVALSLIEILGQGAFIEIPKISSSLGQTGIYPFWLTFFSWFGAAMVLDFFGSCRVSGWPPEIMGMLWGGTLAGFYTLGVKLWMNGGSHVFSTGWNMVPEIAISWYFVGLMTLLGALGGALGFLASAMFQSVYNHNKP